MSGFKELNSFSSTLKQLKIEQVGTIMYAMLLPQQQEGKGRGGWGVHCHNQLDINFKNISVLFLNM